LTAGASKSSIMSAISCNLFFEHWLQDEPQFRPYCLPHYSLEGKHFSTVQAAEDCSRLHPVQALHFVETQLLIAASIT